MGRLNYDSAPARNVPTAAPGDSSSNPASTAFVQNAVPAGVVLPYAGPVPPAGWLLCDGSNVSRTTYAKLFAAVGTTYGVGDGSTTFKLPDLRGEFVRGLDQGRGVDPSRALGTAQNATSMYFAPNSPSTGGAASNQAADVDSTAAGGSPAVTYTTGGGTPATKFTVRPRNVAMNYIIKFA